MPRDVAYTAALPGGLARIRVELTTEGHNVVTLLIQLEVFHEGQWKAARRYDDAHGQLHIDFLDSAGREHRKVWLDYGKNEALTIGLRDFYENWAQYTAEFLGR